MSCSEVRLFDDVEFKLKQETLQVSLNERWIAKQGFGEVYAVKVFIWTRNSIVDKSEFSPFVSADHQCYMCVCRAGSHLYRLCQWCCPHLWCRQPELRGDHAPPPPAGSGCGLSPQSQVCTGNQMTCVCYYTVKRGVSWGFCVLQSADLPDRRCQVPGHSGCKLQRLP